MIRFVVHDQATSAYLKKVQSAFASGDHVKVLQRVAYRALASLVSATPKGFTGNTRQRWVVIPIAGRGYVVTNTHKVMMFLELGTKAHGPVTAKMLYIPLNRAAAIRGWHKGLVRGVDYVLAKRVRGIRAKHIVSSRREGVYQDMRSEMIAYLRRIT